MNKNIVPDDDIVISSDGVLCDITYKVFYEHIGSDLEEVLKRNKDSHEIKMAAQDEKIDYSHIKLENLINIKKLGAG